MEADTKPIHPRITDPNLIPEPDLESGVKKEEQPAQKEKGWLTSFYDNKLMFIVIFLVIIIIGIVAYVVLRNKNKPAPQQQNIFKGGGPPMQPQPQSDVGAPQKMSHGDIASKLKSAAPAPDFSSQVAAVDYMKETAKQGVKPAPKVEELDEPQAQPQAQPQETEENSDNENDDIFEQKFMEETLSESAEKSEEEPPKEEENHPVATCGALLKNGGYCRNRANYNGRCHKHM